MGTGAVAAAAAHAEFDLAKLSTWEAGKPVPFSFLVATFEGIADESKASWQPARPCKGGRWLPLPLSTSRARTRPRAPARSLPPRPPPPPPPPHSPPPPARPAQRLAITTLLTNAFRAVIATTPADLLPTLYLCTNRVAPAHEGVELGIGESTLIKVWWRWWLGAWVGGQLVGG